MECIGPSFDGFAYLPAVHTRAGILLAWDSSILSVDSIQYDSNSLTGLAHTKTNFSWWITVVYAPQGDDLKSQLLLELEARCSVCPGPWLVLGYFNMILRASEKNNPKINRGMMAKFRGFVDDHELKELFMHGRMFTWSNERAAPTLTKIDRVLVSVDLELAYHDYFLQDISSSVSDHAPLHLSTNMHFCPKKRFRFELFWTKIDGFEDAVREVWVCDDTIVDPFKRLDTLLRNTAMHLLARGQRRVGNIKILMAVANWIIFRFDQIQEFRWLSTPECWLRRLLKLSLLGLASLERSIDRQRSRMKWLREGDANTKLFQAVANGMHTKNFIPSIVHGSELITDQPRKEEVFADAFEAQLGMDHGRAHSLDLDFLGLGPFDLSELDRIFTEEEV
ncbi:hypothetical protein D1007_02998 [Hordeum vulgare]|nr:hypothetical protein D1007_02998 [Hordeum vulgare]